MEHDRALRCIEAGYTCTLARMEPRSLVVSTSPVDGLKEWLKNTKNAAAFLASDEGKLAKKAIPFFRLWCIVELVAAIVVFQDHLPVLRHVNYKVLLHLKTMVLVLVVHPRLLND